MPESSQPHKRPHEQREPSAPRNDWLEGLARFNLRFGRFVRDAIGVSLIALAVMSLFAVLEFIYKHTATGTEGKATVFLGGAILAFVADRLTRWFGWGGFLILFATGYLGYSLLRRDSGEIR